PLESAEFILSAIQFLTDMGIYPWTEDVLKRRIQAFPLLIEKLLQAPSGSFQFLVERMQTLS
ncbi:MAG: TetR/AcrR family transcriptional regulator, partial [Verrucomicrobia bacterium]|nr:TetR/AcrR family transcriptional regulator [Verrucomicrobiota bacterium]